MTRNECYRRYLGTGIHACVIFPEMAKPRACCLAKTTMKSEGTMPDLNRIIAYMLAASSEYFGSSIGMQIDKRIGGHDPRLLEIWK